VTARDASAVKRDVFDHLIGTGDMDIRRSAILDVAPPPLLRDFDFGRVEGMMLALAIGEALGNTTEGMLPAERRRRHGEITDYLPNAYAGSIRRFEERAAELFVQGKLPGGCTRRGLKRQRHRACHHGGP
jgi:hypothetical protein